MTLRRLSFYRFLLGHLFFLGVFASLFVIFFATFATLFVLVLLLLFLKLLPGQPRSIQDLFFLLSELLPVLSLDLEQELSPGFFCPFCSSSFPVFPRFSDLLFFVFLFCISDESDRFRRGNLSHPAYLISLLAFLGTVRPSSHIEFCLKVVLKTCISLCALKLQVGNGDLVDSSSFV